MCPLSVYGDLLLRIDLFFVPHARACTGEKKQDGKLVKVFTNVESKVKKHSEEVIEALKVRTYGNGLLILRFWKIPVW